ncbi:hypothetical protein [Streptosporangium sp. 'caverna']|uniref:hypothetical protein n=1 Tax=Streptosporangium sp. 'caverna' TaxID=2202249 RepID=UPI0013A69FF5|nr:hypothetical protein [Streptosporangium sp. 'caverna']
MFLPEAFQVGQFLEAPKTTYEVDRRGVVNHAQARVLLDAMGKQARSGPRLVAFFAVMYYAGLPPEEVVDLRDRNVTLPDFVQNEDTGEREEPAGDWGEPHFAVAAPFAGREWTDSGTLREERALKHRPDGHTRNSLPAPAYQNSPHSPRCQIRQGERLWEKRSLGLSIAYTKHSD